METSFFIYGHKNILATHKSTLEFTTDDSVTLSGDCIVGVSSKYKLLELFKFRDSKVHVSFLFDDKVVDTFDAYVPSNITLESDCIIFRKSTFIDCRTFAILSSKAAKDLDRTLVTLLRNGNKIKVLISKKD